MLSMQNLTKVVVPHCNLIVGHFLFVTYPSHIIYLVPKVSLLPRGFSVFTMVSGVLDQYFGINEPLSVSNLTRHV